MRERDIRLPALLFTTAIAVAVACSPAPSPEVPGGSDGVPDAVLVLGREIYSDNCARCHASDGKGGQGPQLSAGRAVEVYADIGTQKAIVREGRRSMPSFGAVLDEAELDAVVRYTREVL